jgi:hypothetical protein
MKSFSLHLVVAAAVLCALGRPTIAQDAAWNGSWFGLWGGRGATSVTILDGRVTNYTLLGRSHVPFDVTFSGDTVSFRTDEVTDLVTLKRVSPTKAEAVYRSSTSTGTATLTKP